MTIKTTIALEFTSRHHRDMFLRAFQTMLFTFGNKAPKVKMRLTLETECEFGDPSAIDLFSLGVEDPDAPQSLTPIEDAITRLTAGVKGIDAGSVTFTTGEKSVTLNTAPEPTPEPAPEPEQPAEETPAPEPTLAEIVLQTLAAKGPLTLPALAQLVQQPTFALTVELERLHEAGDVEPDDGERWRLVDREDGAE